MNTSPSINFKEEFSSKIPALTLLMNLGYRYLSPEECLQLRSPKSSSLQTSANSSNQVMLLPILREFLAAQIFHLKVSSIICLTLVSTRSSAS